MITRSSKAILLIILLLSFVLVTISVYSYNENPKEDAVLDYKTTSDTSKKVPVPPSTSTPIEPTASSSIGSSGPSSSSGSSTSSKPNIGSRLGELVDKILKSDENLDILVSAGMKKELDEYFKEKQQLKSFNLSSEMEKAVEAEIKRICVETARSNLKTRRTLKKEYKKTIEEKKKKFKEECDKGPLGKGKKMKKVKIKEKSNEGTCDD